MKILILGGCGYTGTVLVNDLLKKNHKIIVVDTQWFGNFLKKNKNLKVIKQDIRKINEKYFKGVDSIIHLANIANDPGVELNSSLSWEVNVLATKRIADLAVKNNVKQIIYASSGSVYGVKKQKKVTEDLELVPISTYNKTKMIAERVLMSYNKKIKVQCIRPATVCGLSPKMRLDVSVNNLTWQANKSKKIKVFGGSQIRPNIHIKDLVRVYIFFLKNKKIKSGYYNAGFENLSILQIAKLVKKIIPSKIVISKSNDIRSYRQDSSKLTSLGFKPEHGVVDAIKEITTAYSNKKLIEKKYFYTVNWMKKLGLQNG
jgi:nucleoside-diphosphate-sugar epimerase